MKNHLVTKWVIAVLQNSALMCVRCRSMGYDICMHVATMQVHGIQHMHACGYHAGPWDTAYACMWLPCRSMGYNICMHVATMQVHGIQHMHACGYQLIVQCRFLSVNRSIASNHCKVEPLIVHLCDSKSKVLCLVIEV